MEKTFLVQSLSSSFNGMFHDSVNHSQKEFARGNVHTNTIEGFWGQLKRSIDGTYHGVSKKHLQTYVDEFAYRYSLRSSEIPLFHLLMASALRLPDGGGQKTFSFRIPVA
jgi:transposase